MRIVTLLLLLLLPTLLPAQLVTATTEMPFNPKFVQPMHEIMTAFNLAPEQNWVAGAPCSDDGTGGSFKGVICDSQGNPTAMVPTLGNSLADMKALPAAFAKLTTLTRLVLIMGLINARLDDFARQRGMFPTNQVDLVGNYRSVIGYNCRLINSETGKTPP